MRDRDRYLMERDCRYYYARRIPSKLAQLDKRGRIRFALNTGNISIARDKRDKFEYADDLYWSALIADNKQSALQIYQATLERASLLGFTYTSAAELAKQTNVDELLERVEVINSDKDVATAEAALGSATRPKLKLIKAFDLYVAEIAASEVAGKSPAQRTSWEKVKLRAVKDFIKVVGDIPLENISREDADLC